MRNSKLWLLPLVMVFFGLTDSVFAQSSSYIFSTSSGTFDTLSAGINAPNTEADSDVSNPIDIGFDFVYSGVTYDTVVASSNGFLSFNENAVTNTANNLDGVGAASLPLVAPLWDDHAVVTSSYASYETSGTAPNRVFTFEWKNWEWNWQASAAVVTFQVKLYETSNVIEFHYRDEGNAPNNPSASIGIADASSFLSLTSITTPTVSVISETSTLDAVPATGTIYTFTPSTCLVPTNVSVVSVGTDTAKFSWDFGGSGSTFAYLNVLNGVAPSGQGTVVNADSVVINSLNSATSYDFYVREICGAGDSSNWVGPFSYATNCNLISAFPWVEDFESATTPNVPICFSVNNANNDGDEWESQSSSTYANSGSQSMEMYTDFNSGNNDDYLILPGFDLTGNERLRYWFRARSSGEPNDFQVLVSQTGTAPADFTDTVEVDTATSTTYAETIIDLSAYTGATYIAFHIPNGGLDGWYLYVDDMVVEAIPSCVVPSNVSLVSLGTDTAKISWDFAGAGTQFAYINVAAGTTPSGQGTVISADSVTVSSLSANTSYDFYVREICGAGDSSAWVGPFSYTTNCNLISAFPWVEDFESATTPDAPACFSVNNANNDGDEWESQSSSTYANSGSQSMEMYTDFNSGNNDDYLILPGFDLTGNERLRYWFRARSTGEPNDFQVLVSQTGTAPADFTDTVEVDTATSTTYAETIIDISAYTGATYIAFHIPNGGLDGWYLYVDDMVVEAIPTCLVPTNIVAQNIGIDTAKMSWDFANTGTQFAYINVAAGTTPSGQGTVISADSVTVSSLSANTSYDFYVREICGAGDSSAWVGPLTYSTLCNVFTAPFSENFDGSDWVAGTGFNNAGDDISSCWNRNPATNSDFFWGARTGTTGSSGTGPDSDNTTGSGNYVFVEASNGSVGDIAQFETPTIDLAGLANPALRFSYHMYGGDIDRLYIYATQGGVTTVVDSIVGEQQLANSDAWKTKIVDLSAFAGTNVILGWELEKTGIVNTSGFAADVAIDDVEVLSILPNDVGVTAFVTPASFCGDSITELIVVIENFGSAQQSGFNVSVDWTGSTTGTVSTIYNGTLGAGEVDTVIVDTVSTVLGGTFNLAGYTDLVGDGNINNDTTLAPGVTFFPLPVVNLGANIAYCTGTAFSTTLDAGNVGSTYLWNDGSTTQTLVVDTAGTYYVEVTSANGCIGTDTIIVTEDAVMVDLGADDSYCAGTAFSTTLDAGNAGATYLWDDGSTAQTLVVDTAGVYFVVVTNGNGCTATDTVVVSEQAAPNVSVADEEICDGETGTLDAGAGFATYAWNTSATTQTIDVTMAGTYTVTVINAAGCSSVDSATVTVNTVTVSIPDFEGCEGTTVEIDAGTGYASYAWSTGETTQSIQVTSSNDYSVTVTSAEGCIAADTAAVLLNPLPVVDLGPDTALADGESITLDAGNSGATYNWSTGASTQTIIVNSDDVPATISVEVTQGSCSATDEIVITKSVGVEAVVRGGVSTYPNPVDNEFHIAFTAIEGGNISIEVYDVSGQLIEVSNNKINSGREDLVVDMSAYGSGVYIVKATLNNQVIGQFRAVKR